MDVRSENADYHAIQTLTECPRHWQVYWSVGVPGGKISGVPLGNWHGNHVELPALRISFHPCSSVVEILFRVRDTRSENKPAPRPPPRPGRPRTASIACRPDARMR